MRASAVQRHLPGLVGRQVDRHVHVGQIDQGQRLAAGRQHLAGFRAVEHAPLIGAFRLVSFSVARRLSTSRSPLPPHRLGDPALRLRHAGHRAFHAGLVAIQLVALMKPRLDQFLGALQVLPASDTSVRDLRTPACDSSTALRACTTCASAALNWARRSSASSRPTTEPDSTQSLARPKAQPGARRSGGKHRLQSPPGGCAEAKPAGSRPGDAGKQITPSGKHRQSEHPKDKIANAHQVHKPPTIY